MLERIKELAMEKFATEAEVDAFMEGFAKQASEDPLWKTAGLESLLSNSNIARPLGSLAVGLAGIGIAKGIHSAYSATSEAMLHSKFESSLAQVMSQNRIVRGADPVKVKQYAETVFKFAPHVAADPNLLSFTLANIVQGDSGIDLVTIKNLTDLEGRYKDNNTRAPLVGIKV
jgi:hypothetical protein